MVKIRSEMKPTRILSLCFLLFAGSSAAQDLIVRTDALEIQAKVMEITPGEVRYKRFSNPEGPTYVLPVAQIRYILYPNGEKDVFRDGWTDAAPEGVDTPVCSSDIQTKEENRSGMDGAVQQEQEQEQEQAVPFLPVQAGGNPAVERVPEGYVLRTYAIGDFYENGEVRGVVCSLDADKLHGLILSLDEVYLPWSNFRKPDWQRTGAINTSDGEANMQIMAQFIEENDLSWDDFPAFSWCRKQGEGWYLPAIDEILQVCANFNGGSRIGNNREARNRFNDALRENGGKRMDRLVFYFSSTERDAKTVLCTHTSQEPPYVADIPKTDKFLVRAVRKF